ncbi:MAG TPA: oligopeptide/dipeptide ABC transporter ATP-binding protein [Desertimonas sp.]|nr:oligopeptide/dipeptide ABC transporter ATP-binding protein [Desertimonas sp.]
MSGMLDVEDLRVTFTVKGRGALRGAKVTAVDGVSLSVQRRETVGLVGESGCGKSTFAHALVRLVPFEGRISLDGDDVTDLRGAELVKYRRRVQLVFQDPYASLNPRLSVRRLIAEPLVYARRASGGSVGGNDVAVRVNELLGLVGLPAEAADRYPHEFSGGQRQRIGLARALSVEPAVILADEPVSALDVSIQAQIINLLVDLQDRLHLTLVFIAHDLAVVRHVSDRVGVMYLGRIVELGPTDDLYRQPLHPYTVALLSAVPVPDPEVQATRRKIVLTGDAPSPLAVPSGCRFHPRCPIARPERCATDDPPLVELYPGRFVACHYPGELETPAAH